MNELLAKLKRLKGIQPEFIQVKVDDVTLTLINDELEINTKNLSIWCSEDTEMIDILYEILQGKQYIDRVLLEKNIEEIGTTLEITEQSLNIDSKYLCLKHINIAFALLYKIREDLK